MWRAIQSAAGNKDTMYLNKVHPINGLRVIRFFEASNPGVDFDPFNSRHLEKIRNNRPLAAFLNYKRSMEAWGRDLDASIAKYEEARR